MKVLLALLGLGCAVAALVGLPLFGDGAHYFFEIALDGTPLIPQGRLGAALLQLPVLLAWRLTDDLTALRHAFAFGYALVPWVTLLACWWLVRQRSPWLVLFPLLAWLALQINFSAVSELLLSLLLAWPLGLALWLAPTRRGTLVYGLLLAVLLVLLHPLGFLVAWTLALIAAALALPAADPDPAHRRARRRLAGWFALAGAVRLGWTLLGLTGYERGRLAPDPALHYLLPDTGAQLALLLVVALAGLLVTGIAWAGRRPGVGRLLAVSLRPVAWSLPWLALVIGAGFLLGDGVKLKAVLSVLVGLGLLPLAVLAGWLTAMPGSAPRPVAVTPLVALATAAILLLTLARAGAWWTATRVLTNLTLDTDAPCLRYGADTPYALQWPWLVIIDDWAVPMRALVFRGDPALGPTALLLPGDGCERLVGSDTVVINSWLQRPFADLDARFGPLRRPVAD